MESSLPFADMGVDSPMSIAIISDFRKQTGVELPAAFFSSNPTPADVQVEFGAISAPAEEVPMKSVPAPAQSPPKLKASAKPRSGKRSESTGPKENNMDIHVQGSNGDVLLNIAAKELGIDPAEMTASTDFTSMGVDSTLSIKVLSIFKKQTGVELPAAFFNGNPTVADVRKELDGHVATADRPTRVPDPKPAPKVVPSKPAPKPKAATTKQPSAMQSGAVHNAVTTAPVTKPLATVAKPRPEPESRTILIQGKPRSTDAPLFLATDGSGAVSAYIHLPPLPNGRKIYALESPFLECPGEYTLTVQEMADIFIKSIRKLQPQGPYLIGGWSAGSIYAYEIGYRLVMQGEHINGLVIMDMRVPHSVPDAETVTMAFVEKTGAFTGVNRASNFIHGLSEKQKMHLTSTVHALIRYDPLPFPKGKEPAETHLIWATKGLNDSLNPDEHDDRITGPAAMGPAGDGKPLSEMTMEEFEIELKSWFFAKRCHFGSNGWEDLVGESIKVHKIDGGKFKA